MDNITTSKSISVEELQADSNLIIYIVGLILLIVWKCHWHWTLETQPEKLVERYQQLQRQQQYNARGPPKAKYKTEYPIFLLSV